MTTLILSRTANFCGCLGKMVRTAKFGAPMKITTCDEFGKMVKDRRKELKYTQAFLSECSGLSVSFISDVEHGKPTAELGKCLFLANLLGLDISVLQRL